MHTPACLTLHLLLPFFVGFCWVFQVKVDQNITFEIYDLAGQANLRPSWASYYQATHAVIVVADCGDRCGAVIHCMAEGLPCTRGAHAADKGSWRLLQGHPAHQPRTRPLGSAPLPAPQRAAGHPQAGAVQAVSTRAADRRVDMP